MSATRRFWPLVFLDGWRAEIEEDIVNGVLSVTVIGETGRAWHTTRETIFEAIDVAQHILAAERTAASDHQSGAGLPRL